MRLIQNIQNWTWTDTFSWVSIENIGVELWAILKEKSSMRILKENWHSNPIVHVKSRLWGRRLFWLDNYIGIIYILNNIIFTNIKQYTPYMWVYVKDTCENTKFHWEIGKNMRLSLNPSHKKRIKWPLHNTSCLHGRRIWKSYTPSIPPFSFTLTIQVLAVSQWTE